MSRARTSFLLKDKSTHEELHNLRVRAMRIPPAATNEFVISAGETCYGLYDAFKVTASSLYTDYFLPSPH